MSLTIKSRFPFVRACAARHLAGIPESVRLVVMLGSNKKYIAACHGLLGGEQVFPTAPVSYAYRVEGTPYLHLPHPSGAARGYKAAFCSDRDPSPGERNMLLCRKQAEEVIATLGGFRRP